MGWPWDQNERALLRTLPPAEVAWRTGRTVYAVRNARCRYHCAAPVPSVPDRRLAGLHARGWCDAQIAAAVGLSGQWAGRRLRRLGLPANRDTDAARRYRRKAHRASLIRRGYDSIAQLRYTGEHRATLAAGWPAGATRKDGEALECLRLRGSLTARALSAALGLAYCGGRGVAVRMGRCLALGWVVRSLRPGSRGLGGTEAVYELAPAVRRRREQVLACRGGAA